MNKKNATLVIMAAGMGSRFGGLKQVEPVGLDNEVIADYSVFDAKKAGFNKVIFIIKREMEQLFKEKISDRLSKYIDVELVFQEINILPEGFVVPEGRKKPWGTGHAVLCCEYSINEPFAVINADDFYGASAFADIYNFITAENRKPYEYCMAGYSLKNTVTDSGSVSRGACVVDKNNFLLDVNELTHIEKTENGISYKDEEGSYTEIDPETIVSMNAWGFMPSLFEDATMQFANFLTENSGNILKAEYYLANIVKTVQSARGATVTVLPSKDSWYGFTYASDKIIVKNAIKQFIQDGKYPNPLWK